MPPGTIVTEKVVERLVAWIWERQAVVGPLVGDDACRYAVVFRGRAWGEGGPDYQGALRQAGVAGGLAERVQERQDEPANPAFATAPESRSESLAPPGHHRDGADPMAAREGAPAGRRPTPQPLIPRRIV